MKKKQKMTSTASNFKGKCVHEKLILAMGLEKLGETTQSKQNIACYSGFQKSRTNSALLSSRQ